MSPLGNKIDFSPEAPNAVSVCANTNKSRWAILQAAFGNRYSKCVAVARASQYALFAATFGNIQAIRVTHEPSKFKLDPYAC
jgi:hypothetical protein